MTFEIALLVYGAISGLTALTANRMVVLASKMDERERAEYAGLQREWEWHVALAAASLVWPLLIGSLIFSRLVPRGADPE